MKHSTQALHDAVIKSSSRSGREHTAVIKSSTHSEEWVQTVCDQLQCARFLFLDFLFLDDSIHECYRRLGGHDHVMWYSKGFRGGGGWGAISVEVGCTHGNVSCQLTLTSSLQAQTTCSPSLVILAGPPVKNASIFCCVRYVSLDCTPSAGGILSKVLRKGIYSAINIDKPPERQVQDSP